ncbi:hypothetical protein FHT44_002520 [Mycolicibacterium sp. BK634]|uniref:hypothetical protein n=1 Tax=Mycolicibacterium sp. BK634 TaxID=2587099 RepID=UPI0016081396|nr:hypothetical protein [Mycolicibacterium sp. BK634]MBB3750059.1 hypothetical protein [Mycolicibacterium sp. BK634]
MLKRALAAVALSTLPSVLTVAPAQADPLPVFCAPATVVDNVCTARLTSVTADVINGTITGAPVGGGAPVTLAGQLDAYQKSTGFSAPLPDAIHQWDTNIDNVNSLSVDPSDPGWYGNAKSRVFMPRTLNDLAVQFPPDVLVVRFTPDDAAPGTFRLVSIQPTAP